MHSETYSARPHTPQPPKLVMIEDAIRRKLEHAIYAEMALSNNDAKVLVVTTLKSIMDELLDTRLIGIPDLPRTSVRVDLVEELGKQLSCRKHEDADDVLMEAVRRGGK